MKLYKSLCKFFFIFKYYLNRNENLPNDKVIDFAIKNRKTSTYLVFRFEELENYYK